MTTYFRSKKMVPSETSVLFVGLGTMGLPMATNLVKAGFRVIGADSSEAAVASLVERGGGGVDGRAYREGEEQSLAPGIRQSRKKRRRGR